MGFWRKKRESLPVWTVRKEDFLEDDLSNYPDLNLNLILDDIREIIPRELYGRAFIAGGFPAHLAGITKDHTDVDIFCMTSEAYDEVESAFLKRATGKGTSEKSSYGTSRKVSHEGIDYHIVDMSATISTSDIRLMLMKFDINWSMAGINLRTNKLHIHEEALSVDPLVNIDTHITLETTPERIKRYGARLRRQCDPDKCRMMVEGTKEFIKRNAKKTLTWGY